VRRTRSDKTTLPNRSIVIEQTIQIFGSLLVLAAFAAVQAGRLNAKSMPYLVLNVAGSGILAIQALVAQQWGFLLLEGVWALVSLASLILALIRRAEAKRPGLK
jgi:hypothetical protein